MATSLSNTSFKVKAGTVDSLAGLVPEKGGLIYSLADDTLYYGDGSVWKPINPAAEREILQVSGTDIAQALTSTLADWQFFDTVQFQVGTGMTAVVGPPNSITINKDFLAQYSASYSVSSDKNNTNVTILLKLNGTTINTREIVTGLAGRPENIAAIALVPLSDGDVATFEASSVPDATITLETCTIGIQEIIV